MSLSNQLVCTIFLFLFFSVANHSAFAQDESFPQEVNNLLKKSGDVSIGIDERIKFGEDAFQKGVELGDSVIQVEAKYAVVKALSDNGKFVDALLVLDYLTTLEKDKRSENFAFILNKYGLCYYRLGMTNRSIEKFREAKSIFEEHNNTKQVLSCLNNIASVFYASTQYEFARESLEEVVRLSHLNDIPAGSAEYNLGVSNLYLEDYGRAEKHLLNAVESAKQENDLESLRLNQSKLGLLYNSLRRNAESDYYINLSKEPLEGMTIKTRGFILLDQILIYIDRDEVQKAKEHLKLLKELIEPTDLHDTKLKMYGAGMRIAKKRNHLEDYIDYSESFRHLSDSLSIAQNLVELDVYNRLGAEQSENQQLLLEQKNLEAEDQKKSLKILEYERNTYRIVFWFMLLFMLAIAGIFLLRRKARRVKERNQNLRTQSNELAYDLKVKHDQLTDLALYLGQNKQLLINILERLKKSRKKHPDDSNLTELISQISEVVRINKDQQKFYDLIEEINATFVSRVKQNYPQLTNNDLRLISLIRLNLSSKEIASFSNISPSSVDVNRHRLRKKLGLKRGESIASIDL